MQVLAGRSFHPSVSSTHTKVVISVIIILTIFLMGYTTYTTYHVAFCIFLLDPCWRISKSVSHVFEIWLTIAIHCFQIASAVPLVVKASSQGQGQGL